MDRKAISQALAKALAYHAIGNAPKANNWARDLIDLLTEAGVIGPVDTRPPKRRPK